MSNKSISILEAIRVIDSGKVFSCTFNKRNTNESRHIIAKKRKPKKDGKQRYSFGERNLFVVYDLQKKGYRTIPLEGLVEVNGSTIN